LTVPSLFATRNALASSPLPQKPDVDVVDPVGVHVQRLPVRLSVYVDAETREIVAVAGAHDSVPRSPVRVVAAPVAVTAAVNVPLPSFLLVIVPLALARVPVPLSFASAWW
jgi:hypothetical protein